MLAGQNESTRTLPILNTKQARKSPMWWAWGKLLRMSNRGEIQGNAARRRWGCNKVCAFSVHDGWSFPLQACRRLPWRAIPISRSLALQIQRSVWPWLQPQLELLQAAKDAKHTWPNLELSRARLNLLPITAVTSSPRMPLNSRALARVFRSSSGRCCSHAI